MKRDKLFRETAFGGYKREDVLKYIDAADRSHREAVDELNDRILELNEGLVAASRKNEALEQELEIKTAFAREAEDLKRQMEEKDAQIEELIARCQELSQQTDAVVKQCEELTSQMEGDPRGFSCDRLEGKVCAAVREQAEQILNDAEAQAKQKLSDGEAQAKQKISDAEEQASGILLKARIEAQSMITEAEGQTEALARQVSDEAHEIITMTLNEAKGIIGAAKAQSEGILSNSAHSIGKIKGNLSSMQMVVKNIENELKSAKESLSNGILKGED